jgi:hypothetical protein
LAVREARAGQRRPAEKKRNITGYERAGTVSETNAVEMRRLAIQLFDDVIAWLRDNRTDLLEKR